MAHHAHKTANYALLIDCDYRISHLSWDTLLLPRPKCLLTYWLWIDYIDQFHETWKVDGGIKWMNVIGHAVD